MLLLRRAFQQKGMYFFFKANFHYSYYEKGSAHSNKLSLVLSHSTLKMVDRNVQVEGMLKVSCGRKEGKLQNFQPSLQCILGNKLTWVRETMQSRHGSA